MKGLTAMLMLIPSLSAAAPITPSALLADIQTRGVDTVIQRMTDEQAQPVFDGIARGDPDWIRLAPVLAPGLDGGWATWLGVSLASALPRNAYAVLAIIDEGKYAPMMGTSTVCGMPFFEEQQAFYTNYYHAARRALLATGEKGKRCLLVLEQAKQQAVTLSSP
ncbi:hypothetical protein [Chimaeribacter coloradensis]|nr:hypothetical protein [Chimaeribacter coloradensis]